MYYLKEDMRKSLKKIRTKNFKDTLNILVGRLKENTLEKFH